MNIKAALQQRAKELNIALPKLLQHYAMERFLYRLSLLSSMIPIMKNLLD